MILLFLAIPLLAQVEGAHWGAHAIDLATGEVLLEHNHKSAFTPASNTKLLTTALALSRLGPDHRMLTRIGADSGIAEGRLRGNLYLIGGGDTTLSGRAIPYQVNGNGNGANALAKIEQLAAGLVNQGLRVVEGDVVGDDTAYVHDPYPEGWSVDDALYEYGAPVSALILHDNAVRVSILAGDPPRVQVRPSCGFFNVTSRVQTGAASRVYIEPTHDPTQISLYGTVARGAATGMLLAVRDPALYAAWTLREALIRQGVNVKGGYRARHRVNGQPLPAEPPEVLATLESPPLVELLTVVNKVSQNLHAEVMLRETARRVGGKPDVLMKTFLEETGITNGDYRLEDGSGLSRLTLASPRVFTSVLTHMLRGPHAEAWLRTLPVGGEDGTLERRFRGKTEFRVLAKTGSLSHVAALSGYLDRRDGKRIAFSILVNNANAPQSTIRAFVDKIVWKLAGESGPE
jgi:D-alanyl-D-alanine carboxypeptidase/D-alanyl-D-alanine-endopeptidase (penicillin-binding protein 4)